MKPFAAIILTLGAVLGACSAPANGEDAALALPAANTSPGESNPLVDLQSPRPPEAIPLPPVASPATDDELTLAEAEAMAVAFQPAIREAEARVRAAHGNWVQVGLGPNPEIAYSGVEIGNDGTAGQQGGFISQEFVTAGKLDLNRAVALREKAAAEQRFAQVRFQVITMIRNYYFECLAADRAFGTAEELNSIAAKFLDISKQRHGIAKTLAKTSVLQSEIESESAGLLVEQARQRKEAARRRLATAIGSQDPLQPKLEDVFTRELPDLDFVTIRERIVQDSPALAELRFNVDRARWAVQRASAGRVPNMSVQAGVQYDNAAQDTIANVQVSVPIPVRDRNQGAIAEACGRLAAAQAALAARAQADQERLLIVLRDYNTARERVKKYTSKIKPAAEESLGYINLGYEGGKLEYAEVYNVQQTYSAKSLSYVQDLETAWQQWAEIDGFLLGEVTPGGIDRTSQTSENSEEKRY